MSDKLKAENDKHHFGTSEIVANLELLQKPIERMASNSALCKGWCITIVSAMLVLIADKGRPELVFLAAIPLIIFLFLDAYYLFLERQFRKSYESFVKRVLTGGDISEVMFSLDLNKKSENISLSILFSISLWWFYGMVFVLLFLAKFIVE